MVKDKTYQFWVLGAGLAAPCMLMGIGLLMLLMSILPSWSIGGLALVLELVLLDHIYFDVNKFQQAL